MTRPHEPKTPPAANPQRSVNRYPSPGTVPDYGAVLDCVMSCTGRPDCPWRCTVLGGAA